MNADNKNQTLAYLRATVRNCQKIQLKFKASTSQHTLLKNRIHALETAIDCLEREIELSEGEAAKVMPPMDSMLHKLTKAQSKYDPETNQYQRFETKLQKLRLAKKALTEAVLRGRQAE